MVARCRICYVEMWDVPVSVYPTRKRREKEKRIKIQKKTCHDWTRNKKWDKEQLKDGNRKFTGPL